MNRFNDEKYDTLSESDKCETPNCENKKEWKYTFHRKGVIIKLEVCSDCCEALLDNTNMRFHDLEKIEPQKILIFKKNK